jgi:hypothetical protein
MGKKKPRLCVVVDYFFLPLPPTRHVCMSFVLFLPPLHISRTTPRCNSFSTDFSFFRTPLLPLSFPLCDFPLCLSCNTLVLPTNPMKPKSNFHFSFLCSSPLRFHQRQNGSRLSHWGCESDLFSCWVTSRAAGHRFVPCVSPTRVCPTLPSWIRFHENRANPKG